MAASGQLDRAGFLHHPVRATIVGHQLAIDGQDRTVVRLEAEFIGAGFVDLEVAAPARAEVFGQLGLVELAAAVAEVHLLVDAHQHRLGRAELLRVLGGVLEVLADQAAGLSCAHGTGAHGGGKTGEQGDEGETGEQGHGGSRFGMIEVGMVPGGGTGC